MENSEADQQAKSSSPDLIDHLRSSAKSLAETGQHIIKQLAKESVSRLNETPDKNSVITMNATNQSLKKSNSTPATASQLMRQQLPGLTRQLLGKRFNTVNKIAGLVMPEGSFDKASDQVLELLADFSSLISNSDHILDEAGVESLEKLQGDTERSGRLARALAEKNRYIAIAQGAISGATGVVGAASDIPFSLILALRTVYLTGRAYGFDLDQPEDRALVFDALSKADLSLITEKQAILLGLRTLGSTLETGNIQSLQSLVGSTNDFEPLLKFLSDTNGQLKWKVSPALISKVAPAVGGVVGALYNARLLKEVSESANTVFAQARQQALGHTSNQNSAPESHETATIEDKIINPVTPDTKEEQAVQQEAQTAILQNDDIEKVEVLSRKDTEQGDVPDEVQDQQIHDQLSALADKLVTSQDENDNSDSSSDNTDAQSNDTDEKAAKKPRARKAKSDDTTGTNSTSAASDQKADDATQADNAKTDDDIATNDAETKSESK